MENSNITIRDLLETCDTIGALEISVRPPHGTILKRIHIGMKEDMPRYLSDYDMEIETPINSADKGNDMWGVITKNIPKSILDMKVSGWKIRSAWRRELKLEDMRRLEVDTVSGEEPRIEVKRKPVKTEPFTQMVLPGCEA